LNVVNSLATRNDISIIVDIREFRLSPGDKGGDEGCVGEAGGKCDLWGYEGGAGGGECRYGGGAGGDGGGGIVGNGLFAR
tara:strand:- start:78 stop:317 length:240 start_codon:yes stop_codon:yes gene_type:complete